MSWGVAEAPFPNERESRICRNWPLRRRRGRRPVPLQPHCGRAGELRGQDQDIPRRVLRPRRISRLTLRVLRAGGPLRGPEGLQRALHLRDRTLTWLGVGNVEAVLFHRARLSDMTRHRALLRAGVIGYRLPPLHAEILPLKPFDTLIIATDGIKPDFDEGLTLDGAPEHIADGILARHRSGMDDALVVVARYLGGDRERSPA